MNDNTLRNQTQTSHDWIKKLLADSGDVIQRRLISAFDVSEMIDQVSSQLETHFVEEEQDGGLFDTIAEQAPRLVHHVEQLRLQHESLRDLLRQLQRKSVAGDGADSWWEELEGVFLRLEDAMNRHEQAETRLMQDAYLVDIGSQD